MITPPRLLPINFFRYQKFSGKQEGSFTKFFVSVLWDNFFSTIPWCPLSPMHENFRYRNFLKHWKDPPRNFLALWDKKFSTENRDTPLSLIHKFFSIPENFWNTVGALYEVFRSCETKNFRKKLWCPPPMHQNIGYQNFFETQKGSPAKFFGTVRQKISDRKSWYPLLMQKNFRYPKFSDTPNCSPTKFVDTVRQKILNGKSW